MCLNSSSNPRYFQLGGIERGQKNVQTMKTDKPGEVRREGHPHGQGLQNTQTGRRDKLIEFLLGIITSGITVIIAVLGWSLHQIYDLKGSVIAMDARITAVSERVDRIAGVLPDMRIQIAYEELRKPFEMAVVATKPIESNPGKWAAAVHLFDSIKNVRSTYRIELDHKAIDDLKYRLIGKAVASDLEPISFHELVNWSLEIREPVQIPNYIDAYASTVFRKNSSD